MTAQRIAISGSAGIGKSTLARAISQTTGYTLVPDYVDVVLRERGYSSWREVTRRDEAMQIRLESLARKVDAESAISAFVSDKSVVDYLAYWDMNASAFAPPDKTTAFESLVKNHLQYYDLILLLVWGRMAIKSEPRRNIDPRHQFLVHSAITRRLLELRAPFMVFNQFGGAGQNVGTRLDELKTFMDSRQIGLYVGTFDPPTGAHLRCAEAASTLFDEVWFCPNPDNPNGARVHAPCTDRIHMLQLLSGGRAKLGVYSRDGNPYITPGGQGLVRPRSDLLTEVRLKYPELQFWLIMGSDKLVTRVYENPEPTIRKAGHLVFERSSQYDFRAMSKLDLWVWMSGVGTESSTDVKKRLAQGQSIAGLVPAVVAGYIVERGLYGARTWRS